MKTALCVLIAACSCFLANETRAQTKKTPRSNDKARLGTVQKTKVMRNDLYWEMGGNGGVYSINYERFLLSQVSVRAGAAYFSINPGYDFIQTQIGVLSVPMAINYHFARKKHKFHLGAGVTIFRMNLGIDRIGNLLTNRTIVGTALLGNRYQLPGNRYSFRVAFTPLFNGAFTPWAGIGVGYGF